MLSLLECSLLLRFDPLLCSDWINCKPHKAASDTGAHPSSGTNPTIGAILVSVAASVEGSHGNLTDALTSFPSDAARKSLFIYAGSQDEQVPSIDGERESFLLDAQVGT
jgi:hypothetical protein